MPTKRYRAEEIIHKLREAEVAFAQGKSTGEVCKKLGVSEQTYYPFQFFQKLCLIAADAPVLLTPAVVRVVRHSDLTTGLGYIAALRQKNLCFTKLLDNLFGFESLTWHELPPSLGPKPEFTTLELVSVKGAGQDRHRSVSGADG